MLKAYRGLFFFFLLADFGNGESLFIFVECVGIKINIYSSSCLTLLPHGHLGITYIVSTCVMDLKRFAFTGFKQIDSGYKELVPNRFNLFGEGHTDVQENSIFTLEKETFD